ncbi:Uncharacterised protein [Chlamydia trachomatis]|nr:Uncharacterised protein [Chlamydia trachomatis]
MVELGSDQLFGTDSADTTNEVDELRNIVEMDAPGNTRNNADAPGSTGVSNNKGCASKTGASDNKGASDNTDSPHTHR